MTDRTITVPAHILSNAQKLYVARNASDIFAGLKKEAMPDSFLVEIIEKNVDSALKQKRKQVQTKQAAALAELQAKGVEYRKACQQLGIVLTDAQAAVRTDVQVHAGK